MHLLALVVRMIGAVNTVLGYVFSWFSLGIVLVCFAVVVMRYVFATGFIWMQDLYVWLNGLMFMGMAGYALLKDQHVRVDIFYRPARVRTKAWIDLIGFVAFIIPFVYVVIAHSWAFVTRSWRFMESSGNIGGMPGLYVVKSFIIVFAVVVGLQGLALALRSILVLAGRQQLLPEHLRYDESR
ncbi:MAG: TRAP transporter small permease subunit [Rhodospirillales bacterium]|nr:MAG: TRAP transporter small permease subunit [Rhodospirillales bacterium]